MVKRILCVVFMLALANTVMAQTPQQIADAAKASAQQTFAGTTAAMTVTNAQVQLALGHAAPALMAYNTYKMAHGVNPAIEAAIAAASAYDTGTLAPAWNLATQTKNQGNTQFNAGNFYYGQGDYLTALECYAGADASYALATTRYGDAGGYACVSYSNWEAIIGMCSP